MAHPFLKLFDSALTKSTVSDNLVTKKAQELIDQGYPKTEVCGVLEKLAQSLIDAQSEGIVREAHEALCEEDDAG